MADAAVDETTTAARRWPARTIGLGGVLLVLLGAVLVVRGHAPFGTATLQVDDGVRHAVVFTAPGREGIAVVYDHDQPATWRVTLRNDGPAGVTVTGLDLEPRARHLLQGYAVFVERASGAVEELASVHVAPGASATLLVRGTFANCRFYNERNVDLQTAVTVRWRLLGIPSEQRVALDRDLVVRSPMIVGCPERTVDREDDRRDG